eukprot:CAMPEP_0206265906 /NCGR_PEP_ID=MMETSP0047_2-20121206/30273_1 /ASSEMBLY_ACC=CAM_ASM_000192 /TAXON_ID=195065 /ORGANISM="Chroomonas mesostigmatica_cf, Strain CCMP1168" /LENGTH=62 /DNA_ID=CAMNT_0053693889 /DNA_START=42 /DNA_END=226 /DNA_ORIENTATION=+
MSSLEQSPQEQKPDEDDRSAWPLLAALQAPHDFKGDGGEGSRGASRGSERPGSQKSVRIVDA